MRLKIVGAVAVGLGIITAWSDVCDFLADKISKGELLRNLFLAGAIVIIGAAIYISEG